MLPLDIAAQLGEKIQAIEFDHVFTLARSHSGKLYVLDEDPQGLYAPDVFNDESGDVEVQSDDWEALTGMTGQHGYNGAVMHPSEFIGAGIARTLAEYAEDGPASFVVTEVRDPEPERDDLIGWCILRYVGI